MEEKGEDFIVSELLSELKSENARKDSQIRGLHKTIVATILAALIAVLATVGGFLWYLNQYDFSNEGTTNNTAEGVYAVIDSEGNVIGADLTVEELEQLMEGLTYGESKP